MTSLGKRIMAGVLIAASGAFTWALMAFSWGNRHGPDWPWSTPIYAAYAVLITSWFVLPLGALIGVVMPSVISGCPSSRAFGRGLLLGCSIGLVAAVLTTLMMKWPYLTGQATIVDRGAWLNSVRLELFFNAATMCAVCALWVGVWASCWSRRLNA